MINGMSHITFIARDLNKTANFFKVIFDAQEIYSSGDDIFSISKEMFFMINDLWICIMQGESLSQKTYNHIAFEIDESEFDSYIDKIKSVGSEIVESRPRINGEGRSIYFYDYDNHMFELHTGNLSERLLNYKKALDKTRIM